MKLKNEALVGVVVILGIIAVVIGAMWLSGKPWGEEQARLQAVFQQVGQLRIGNPVNYRGVQVGRVTEIGLTPDGRGVLVTMEVPPDLELPPRPAVVVAPLSLFGDWQASLINMTSVPDLEFTRAPGENVLPGAALPDITELTAVGARIAGDLETLANRVEIAFTEETAIKLRQTVENLQEISEQLTGFVDQQTRTYAGVSRNILDATARVDRVAGRVEAAVAEGGEIQQILANARQASANLEELSTTLQSATRGVPALVASADTTVASLGELAVTLDDVLRSLEPQVEEIGPTIAEARRALASLDRLVTRLDSGEGSLGRLLEDPALYEELQRAITTWNRLLADLQANPGRYIGEFRVF